MNKKTIQKIWIEQTLEDIVLHWEEHLKFFRDNFLLVPSALLIFGYLLGFIGELNKELIEYYFFPLGAVSFLLSTVFKMYFPFYSFPYISKGIKDIKENPNDKQKNITLE